MPRSSRGDSRRVPSASEAEWNRLWSRSISTVEQTFKYTPGMNEAQQTSLHIKTLGIQKKKKSKAVSVWRTRTGHRSRLAPTDGGERDGNKRRLKTVHHQKNNNIMCTIS
ncbi:hypothetical protein KGM_210244 [Danaus plexippus plexippus]|uniref:Uncharacterized protein n=1 Tax=Danaus plexippus plexippus TaxID=278856 RepID=A0A212EUV9_DANPL|nr:hypothetical protein KGM_210244 [Danaus plexippus plexippus]